MAKRKKNEVVETPVEQEAVLEVEKVEGEALPEITEENINDIKESMITAIEADTKTDVVAESFIEDVGKVENQLPTAEELEVPVEKKAEKPKRTRKVATKKSETKKSEAKKPTTATSKEIKLDNLVWLYANSAIQTSNRTISGIVYLWDSKKVSGRYPVTTVADGAGKLGALSGWINAEDLGLE
jgi:hypothetical protein